MRNTKFLLVLAVTAFLSTLAASQMAPPPPAKPSAMRSMQS